MSGFPNSPRLVRAGIVTMDPGTSAIKSIIALDAMAKAGAIEVIPLGRLLPLFVGSKSRAVPL